MEKYRFKHSYNPDFCPAILAKFGSCTRSALTRNIANQYGIAKGTARRWIEKANIDGLIRFDPLVGTYFIPID